MTGNSENVETLNSIRTVPIDAARVCVWLASTRVLA